MSGLLYIGVLVSACEKMQTLAIIAAKHGSTKLPKPAICNIYETLFTPMRSYVTAMLEVSPHISRNRLRTWNEYFPWAEITAMQTNASGVEKADVTTKESLTSPEPMISVKSQVQSTDRFNIILAKSFDAPLFALVRPGGYFVMEEVETKWDPESSPTIESCTPYYGDQMECTWILRRRMITVPHEKKDTKTEAGVSSPPSPSPMVTSATGKGQVSLLTFATPNLDVSLQKHRDWAQRWCKNGTLHCYGRHDLKPKFYEENKATLDLARGAGYWLWKSYIILSTLLSATTEFVAYCDAGSCWRISWEEIEKSFQAHPDCHMLCVEHSVFREGHWTKRDTFITVGADQEHFASTCQRAATCCVFRRDPKSIQFVQDWLGYACIPGLITDAANKLDKPNYPGFIENRHDQSIFSLMTKLRGRAIVLNYEASVAQRVFGGGDWHR
jgi:hypothetical protein